METRIEEREVVWRVCDVVSEKERKKEVEEEFEAFR